MAVRKIVIWPNETLQKVSEWVADPVSEEVKALAADLIDTMAAKGGVGLAAIQIGIAQRVFIAQADRRNPPTVFVNPIIKELIDDPFMVDEGCLSLPGIYEKTMRYPDVILTYQDLMGEHKVAQLGGLEAQIAQHEIDHLDGRIFVEPISRIKKDIYRRKIAKFLKNNRRS